MIHPQLSELTTALTTFLRGTEGDYLVVHAPVTNTQVDFLFRNGCKPYLRLILTDPTTEEANAAEKLGLPTPEVTTSEIPYGPNKGKTRQKVWFWMPISDAQLGAELALAVHSYVFKTPQEAWLWISPIPEPDDWPVPLPKPPIWPPN